ncbi:hypothetical protein [Crateriforma conspicua]|uniref:Tetratricopeptide repeat protein n=1 Tax=Crateriforma conspicua TaxID=2527996 RepID=A0A5C5XY07_9PLAN|nr:hypothetical protein [Crateriforma conspicua]TWT67830.1 hypothetical protein Pan14r_00670 [Crateriforma conspicua]
MRSKQQLSPAEEAQLRRQKRDKKHHRKRWIKENLYWLVFAGVSGVAAIGWLSYIAVEHFAGTRIAEAPDTSLQSMDAALAVYRSGDVEKSIQDVYQLTRWEEGEPITKAMDYANHWLAEFLVDKGYHIQSREGMSRLRHHLRNAAAGDPENNQRDIDAIVAMSVLESSTGKLEGAVYLQETIIDDRGDVRLPMIWSLIELGRIDDADQALQKAEEAFAASWLQSKESFAAGMRMAECLMLQSRFDEAIDAVDDVVAINETQRRCLDQMRQRVFLADFAERHANQRPESSQVEPLTSLLDRYPDCLLAWRLLLRLGTGLTADEAANLQSDIMRMVQEPVAAASLSIARAQVAVENESLEKAELLARRGLEQAQAAAAGQIDAVVRDEMTTDTDTADSSDVSDRTIQPLPDLSLRDAANLVLAQTLLLRYRKESLAVDSDETDWSTWLDEASQVIAPVAQRNPDHLIVKSTEIAIDWPKLSQEKRNGAVATLYAACSDYPRDRWLRSELSIALLAQNRIKESSRASIEATEISLSGSDADLDRLPRTINTAVIAVEGGNDQDSVMEVSSMQRWSQIAVRHWNVRLATTMDELTDVDRQGRLGNAPLDETIWGLRIGR